MFAHTLANLATTTLRPQLLPVVVLRTLADLATTSPAKRLRRLVGRRRRRRTSRRAARGSRRRYRGLMPGLDSKYAVWYLQLQQENSPQSILHYVVSCVQWEVPVCIPSYMTSYMPSYMPTLTIRKAAYVTTLPYNRCHTCYAYYILVQWPTTTETELTADRGSVSR